MMLGERAGHMVIWGSRVPGYRTAEVGMSLEELKSGKGACAVGGRERGGSQWETGQKGHAKALRWKPGAEALSGWSGGREGGREE